MDLSDLLWSVLIYGLVFMILWWVYKQLSPKIPEPFVTVIFWLLVGAAAVLTIGLLLGSTPLIPAGQIGRVQLF